jgi:anti-sigma regulatory factor (Ser/Thr protein kinase)
MTRVVEIPASFDDQTFDLFARSFGEQGDERLLFDAHGTNWATPYGLVGILVAGQVLRDAGAEKPLFTVPSDRSVSGYWNRLGFFDHAEEFFELHGKVPKTNAKAKQDVLLEITPIREVDDVHEVVRKIQERAVAILTHELGLDSTSTMGFAMALSEACQNIVEHSGTSGWVSVQSYNWKKRLGRKIVLIAVSDSGMGFRESLESSLAKHHGDRWGDGPALEAALMQAVSRFRDPGRGQGLKGIRRYLNRWDGKMSVRSGTSRLTISPDWDSDDARLDNLAKFPGSQIQMIIPEQLETSKGSK